MDLSSSFYMFSIICLFLVKKYMSFVFILSIGFGGGTVVGRWWNDGGTVVGWWWNDGGTVVGRQSSTTVQQQSHNSSTTVQQQSHNSSTTVQQQSNNSSTMVLCTDKFYSFSSTIKLKIGQGYLIVRKVKIWYNIRI